MILTADEIRDLAMVAGFNVDGSVDDLEAEYTIHNGPLAGVSDCDGGDPEYYHHVVTCDGCEVGEVQPIGAATERPLKIEAAQTPEQIKADAINELVCSMIGALESGFIDTEKCTLAQIHRVAQHYVKDNYGIELPHITEQWGVETAKLCGFPFNDD